MKPAADMRLAETSPLALGLKKQVAEGLVKSPGIKAVASLVGGSQLLAPIGSNANEAGRALLARRVVQP